jgi:hypothetical protein
MVMSSKLIYHISPQEVVTLEEPDEQIQLEPHCGNCDLEYCGRRRESNSDLPGVSSPFSHDATEADMEISRKRHI